MAELEGLPVDLQITVEAGNWPDENALEEMLAPVVAAASRWLALEAAQPMPETPPELSLLFTDDVAMQAINGEWRAKDKPTNVLSFPAFPLKPGGLPGPMLGDIVLARETIEREAAEMERNFDHHLAHLVVHGYLHLFGYDHIEPGEAEVMEAAETRILATLGISDPYGHTEPVEH